MRRSTSNLELLEFIRGGQHKKSRRSDSSANPVRTCESAMTAPASPIAGEDETPAICDGNVVALEKPSDIIALLEQTLPPVFCRTQVKKLTYGMVNPRTLANRDSLGTGPAGRFTIGRQVWYRKAPFLAYVAQLLQAH